MQTSDTPSTADRILPPRDFACANCAYRSTEHITILVDGRTYRPCPPYGPYYLSLRVRSEEGGES